MVSEWRESTLGRLLSFSNGKSSPGRIDGLPHPVYGSNGVIGFSDETNADPSTIVVGRVGSYCGSLHYSDRFCWVTDNAIRANAFDGNDARFLFYLLQTLHLNNWRSGSGQPLLNQTILSSIPVTVPPPIEQRTIAHILGTLDDKIELTRRMNETLEALSRAIFKDWFVDFGPTRAKAQGRAPYLAPELWNLFPDALDDEDKPVGWTRERIGNHVVAKKGLSYKGAGLTDEANGIPLHNLNSVLEGGGYKNDGLKFYRGNYNQRHIVRPGDLIVANTEQGFDHLLIGYSALVPVWVGEEGLFSHHIFKVEPRPISPLSRIWLHFALSASRFGESIRRFSNGTTVNMLPTDAFEIPELIVPRPELIRAFDEFVGSKLRRQEDAIGESRTLAQTRDLLLPKLMSGEIRIIEAEKAVA